MSSGYVLDADGQVGLEVAEVFGQFITVMVVSEETLQEGEELGDGGGDVIMSVLTESTQSRPGPGPGPEPRL